MTENGNGKKGTTVTLKTVAEYVGLTSGTVSSVLNDSPAARSLPQQTRDRILAAARELNYRPNFFARSLRVKRTYMIGIIAQEIGDAYGGMIISGIEQHLRQNGYFFLTVSHRHDPKLLETYSHLLLERRVEGLIGVDTSIVQPPELPTVAVAGHHNVNGVTNVILNHHTAARMALGHLRELGHTKIAFMKGPTSSSDSEDRWNAILEVSSELGIEVSSGRSIHLEADNLPPEVGYEFTQRLLEKTRDFTALFAYNDTSAIGAIRALRVAGLDVPTDISVVGFDDIQSAAFSNPPMTTVRQPLQKIGEIAAKTLLDRIEAREPYKPEIVIEPEFVVRESTARVNSNR